MTDSENEAKHPRYESNKKWKEINRARVNDTARQWRAKNTDKSRTAEKKWRASNRERKADAQRRRNIGTDGSQLFKEQNAMCAICHVSLLENMEKKSSAHLDHDHSTGRARGWLCRTCNLGLGMFKDRIDLLSKAITYLGLYEDDDRA